jgi:hypothetical protein
MMVGLCPAVDALQVLVERSAREAERFLPRPTRLCRGGAIFED